MRNKETRQAIEDLSPDDLNAFEWDAQPVPMVCLTNATQPEFLAALRIQNESSRPDAVETTLRDKGFSAVVGYKHALPDPSARRKPINDKAILFCAFELTDASPEHPGLTAVVEIEGTPQNIGIAYRDEQGTIIAETTVELFAGKLVARAWCEKDCGSDPTSTTELCDTLDTSEPEPEEPRALSEIIQQPDDITNEDQDYPGAKELADASPALFSILTRLADKPNADDLEVLIEHAEAIRSHLSIKAIAVAVARTNVSRA